MTRRLANILTCMAISLGFFLGEILSRDWQVVETENFIVVGDAGGKDLRRTAKELELFRKVLVGLFPNAIFIHQMPVRVVMFDDQRSFRPFWPRKDGKGQEVGGYFVGGTPAYIALCEEPKPRRRRVVTGNGILHEYVHYFLDNNFAFVPLWINEGLAEVYSTFEARDGGKKVRIGAPLTYPMELLRQEPMLPLERLFSVEHRSSDYTESHRVPMFYSQSWVLVHFLIMSSEYSQSFPSFVKAVDSGASIVTSFEKHFEKSLDEIEEELYCYVHLFSLPVKQYEFKESIQERRSLETARIGKQEVEYYKAELLSRLQREEEAAAHYLSSLEHDPAYAASLIGLAGLRLSDGQLEEAQELLRRAQTSDSESYHLCLLQGILWDTLEEPDKALESYKRAAQLLPESAVPHQMIGLIQLENGNDEAAEKSLKLAVQLDPNNLFLHYGRSFLLLARGKGKEAAAEAATFLRRHRWHDESAAYAALVIYFGRLQQEGIEVARQSLESHSGWKPREDWPLPVFQFLTGNIDVEKLLEAAADNDELTEANAYIGLQLLYTGKKSKGLEHLRWVLDNGNKQFFEYKLAKSELIRLAEIDSQTLE